MKVFERDQRFLDIEKTYIRWVFVFTHIRYLLLLLSFLLLMKFSKEVLLLSFIFNGGLSILGGGLVGLTGGVLGLVGTTTGGLAGVSFEGSIGVGVTSTGSIKGNDTLTEDGVVIIISSPSIITLRNALELFTITNFESEIRVELA